ncbi:MAG: ATP12 family protein [Rhodospirillaceae bacterium]
MKRFYDQATAEAGADGFRVLLDGRPVRTPAKTLLLVPTLALAEAIATEWQAQGEEIRPVTMPLTALASTTLDLTTKQREAVIDQLAAYAGTDLVCYRVEHPPELVAREVAVWQPLLDWAALRHDAALLVAIGVMPRPQPEGACRALRAAVAAFDDWVLTALQMATTGCGSVVIGLALIEGRVDAEGAFEASQLHESFQIERWGEDFEATKRRAALRQDIADAMRFVELIRTQTA